MFRSPRSLAILGLALVAAALFAGLYVADELRSSTGRAPVVSRALGPNDPSFTLERRWDALTHVSISTKGLQVRHAGASVELTAAGAGNAGWTRHRFGVDRPTAFGRESIVVAAPRTEEYLTVTRHVGARTWRWQLASGLSRPLLEDDGSISFLRAGEQAGVRVLPPVVFAADGRDVTPAGAHWSLERSAGSTTLALRLDDASFQTPYVIDPIVIVGSPGQTGATKTGSPLSINVPASVVAGNLLIATISMRDATAIITPPAGWTVVTQAVSNASTQQVVYSKVATGAEPASYSWTWTAGTGATDSSGVVLAYSGIWAGTGSNIDTSTTNTGVATTTAATAAGTAAYTQDMILALYGTAGSSNFTTPAGMTALGAITSTSGAPSLRSSSGSFQVLQPASGAIAAKSSTITSADETSIMVAIRPAAAAASAANSTLTSSPGSVLADGTTTSTMTATIKDANGNPLPGKTVSLAKGSGSSTITTVSGTTDAAGVATFTVKDAAVESTTYTATDSTDAVTVTQTAAVSFTAGPATQTVFTTSPGNTNGATAFTAQPVVKVEDAFGHVITTDNTTAITLAIGTNPSAGTLSGCTTNPITVTAGVATFAGCKINKAGTGYTLTTTNVAGLTNGASSAFNIMVGAATQVTLTTSGSTAGGGSRTLTATVQDAGGNTVTTDNTTQVTFNKNSGTGSASFPAAATASSGVATATATNLLIGTMIVGATTSPVLTVNVAASYTIVAGAASQVTITTSGSTSGGGSRTLTGTVQDAVGNTVTGDNTTQVTFNKASGTGTANFPAAATAVSGVATATATNGLAGTLVVGATTSPVLTVNNAASYTIVLGVASQLVFTTSPANTAGGAAFAAQPVVKVEDGGGNIVTTNNTAVVTLTIGTNPSAGTLSGCTTNPITVTAGVATFASCKLDKAGTGYTLTTTNGSGFTNGVSSSFNITVGAATQVSLTTSGSTAGGGSRTLTATIQDAGGNTVTTDNTTQVTFNKASGTGTATFPAAATASSGVATATATNKLIGTMVVGATTNPVLTINNAASYTIVLGAASQTVFTTSPGNTGGGTAFAAQPVVKVEDAGGNIVTTDNSTQVTLAIGTNPSAGTLSACATNPITVASGVATFAGCKIDKAGTGYTLTTTNTAALANGSSTAFNITVGAATQVTLATSGSTAAGGSRTLTATVRDAGGNTVTTDNTTQVTFNKNSGTGTASFPAAATASSGVASANATNLLTGTMIVGATTSPVLTVNNAASYTIVAGPASQVTITTSGSTAGGGSRTLTATIQDAGGNTVTGDNSTQVTFNKASGTGTATFPAAATAVSGVATATATNKLIGTMIVGATTSPVLTVNNAASYTIVLGASSQTVFTTSPGSTGGGTAFAAQPVVKVEDAGGNVMTTDNATAVTLTIGTNPAGGTLSGCTTNPIAVTAGVATFAGCKLDKAGIGYTLTTTNTAALANGVSSAFNITVGAATQVTLTTSGSLLGGGSRTLTATVQDAGGNTVTTDNTTQVTFNKNSGTGTASFPLAATASSGVATATATNQLIGTMAVGATTNPVLTVNNAASYTIVLGAPSQTVFTTSPANTGGGSAFAAQPVVKVEDAGGNVITTDNTTLITIAIGNNPSSGTLSNCASNPVAVTAGVATFAGCKLDKAGNGYTLTTSNGAGLSNGFSSAFNITVGAATQVSLTTSGSTAGGGSRTLTATVQDAGGNTVTTDNTTQVTFNKASGTGTATFPAAATAVSGVATATATNNLIGTMVVGATTSPVLTVNNASSYTIVLGAASQVSITTSGSTAGGGSRTLTATIQDAGGNTVTTDNTTQVTFNKASGTGTATFPGAATAVNGIATATATNQLIGTMVVGATTSPVLTVNNAASYTIVLGAASQVSLTTSGSTAGGGSRTLTATIQDAGGNTVTTDNTTQVTFNKSSGTGTATFPAAATASSGVATASATNKLIGMIVVGATTSPVLTVNNAASYTIVLGAASQVSITTSGSTAGGGSRTLTATIQDAGGNTVTTDNTTQVTFNKASGTGTATFPGAATAVNGIATATATNQLIGTMVVGATTSPVLTVNNAASYTIVLGAPSQTVFTTSPANTGGGSAFAAQPVVKVEDAGGNVITTDNTTLITIAIGNNPSSGTLSNCASNPVAVTAGVATFAGCKLDKAGNGYTLTTSNGAGLSNGFSSSVNITVGPATQTIFTTSPGNTNGATAFAAQPVVKLEDAGGNIVTTDNTTQLTLTIGTNPSAGTLSSCTTNPITVAAGVATFAACKLDKAGSGYTLTTTNTAALTNGTSSSFNITVGAATQVSLTTSGSTAGGGSRTLTATVQDAGGNPVTTDNTTQVTFNKASGTGTATFPSAATAVNGVATASATNQLIGTMIVGATTSPVLTVNNATSYTIAFGLADHLDIATSGSTAGGGSRGLTGTVKDAGGNTITTDNTTQVTFNKASGTGTASFPAAATASSGVATATATNNLIGTMVVGATTSPVLSVNNAASYTITLGAASQVSLTTSGSTAGGGSRTLTATIQDAGGNTVTGDNTTQVTFGKASGNGAASFPAAVTASSGVAIGTATNGLLGTIVVTATTAPALTVNDAASYTISSGPATHVTITTSGSTLGGGSRTLTATIQDAGGNTVTGDNATQVTFGKASGTGTASFPTAVTAVNGVATGSATNQLIGTMVVGATTSPVLSVNNATGYTIAHGAASQLVFTTQPTGATAGSALTTQPVATIEDAAGNTVTTGADASANVTVTVQSGSGSLQGTTTLAASGGVATFAGLRLDNAGAHTLRAAATLSVPGAVTVDSGSFTVVAASASALAVTAPSTATAGVSFNTLVVTAQDAYGNTVTGYTGTVTFSGGGTGSTLPGDYTFTGGDNGSHTFTATIRQSGNRTITATDTTTPAITGTTSAIAASAAAAASLRLTGAATQTAGATQVLTVTAYDTFGNIATGYTGAHAITFAGASFSPAPSTAPTVTDNAAAAVPFGTAATLTFSGGVSTVGGSLRLVDAESATVTASAADGGAGGSTTINAAGADALSVSVSPASLAKFALQLTSPQTNGTALSGTNTLTAQDAFGNTVPTFNAFGDNVTFTANAPLTGTVSGLHGANVLNSAADFSAGVADLTALGLTYTGNAASGTFTATSQSSKSGVSASVSVAVGSATHFVVTGSGTQTAGQSQPLTITAVDQSGNTATGYSGDVSLTFGGAAAAGSNQPTATDKTGAPVAFGTPTTITFTNGVASAGGSVRLTKAESALVTVTQGGLATTGADRLAVTVSPAAASASDSVLSASPASITANGVATSTITVQAKDAFGNNRTSGGSAVVLNTSRGSLGTVSDAGNGTYTATLTASASAGTASITGTLGGTAIGTPTSVAFVPGAANAAHSVITTASGSLTANGTSTTAVTLRLKDANDNDLTAGSGTIVLATDAGSLGTVTNNGDGTYSATFTAPVLAGTAHITGTLNGTAIGNPATVTLVPGPVSASHSTVSASSGTASTDTGNTVTVTVTVLDANDNPIQGSHVVLDQGATSSSISPVPATGADTAANGLATFTVSDTTAQSVVYSATASGTLVNQTAAVLYQPGAPTQLVYLQQPTNAVAAATVAPPVTVRILDAHANLTSSNAAVALAIKTGTGATGATLAGTATRTASSGIATFNDLSIAKSGTAYRLTATATSLSSADSATFDIAPGAAAAAHSTLTRAPASVTADGSSASTLTVHAKDVNDNNLTDGGAAVVFHTDLGTLSPVTDNGNGTYTATLTSTTAGTANVDATLDGVTVANTVTVGFSAGSVPNAGQSVITGAPTSLAAGATSTITVRAKDVNGNDLTSGGASVVLATDHGTLGSVTDNSDGTYTATLDASTVGVAHVTGTLNGGAIGTPATVTFTAGTADAAHTVLSASPASIVANGATTSTITVQAKDVNDNNFTTGGATVTLNTSRGVLGTVTDIGDGTYTATLTSSTTAGTATITGTYNATAIGNPTTVTFTPGPANATHTTITAGPTTIVANGATTSTITVRAKDVNDNNLTNGGATVILNATGGALSSVTDAGDGTYTATLTSSTTAGTATITGTYNGAAITAQATVTFVPGAVDASHSTVVASSGTASTDAPANATITITVADAHDNPIPGATVTLAANGGLSNISPALGGTSDANGQIVFTVDDAVAQAVVYSATASGTLLVQSASVQFEPGAATHIVYLQQPTAAAAAAAIAPAVTVRILDANNNLTTSTASVSVAIKSGTGSVGATLGGTTTRAAVAGVATFNDLAIAKAGTGYQLTTSSGGITSVDSAPFDINPGAVSAADSTITASPAAINADGSSPAAAVTVRAKDASGNALTSGGGAVVLATSRGSLSSVTDNGDGTYTASLNATGTSGTATITGTIAGTAIGHTASVAFTPPVPVVTIDGGQPAAQTAITSASLTFHSPNDDGNTTFECRLDAAAFAACTSPQGYTGLADGAHTFRVRGVNGNGPGTAVSVSWTVDMTGPSVSLTTNPSAFTNNAVEPLAATASDATTTVASVDFLFAATAGACPTGTLIDTDTSAPYTATWTTPGDGTYVVCAVAHDAVGNASAAPSTSTVTVDQTAPLATLTAPPANVRQTITLHVTSVTDATSGVTTVTFERSPHSAATWTTIGAGVAQGGNAYDGSFDTTSVADGLYDIRVGVTDAAGNVTRQIAGPVRVDNTTPAPVTLDPLSANVRQTIALSSSATDLGSGVASAAYEISPLSAGAWTPVGASFDTTTKADGDYELRVVATDNAGNVGTSAPRQVKIDNTSPAAALGTVPAYIRAALTLSSTTTDTGGSGLATSRYEISAHGAGSWSTIASPLDTTTKADGDYDVRVVAIDKAGNRTDSASQEVVIDNTGPSQSDLTAPAAGAILQHGTPTTLTATAVDATSLIDTIHYRVAVAGTVTGANCNDTLGTQIGSGATTTFDDSSLADGHYDMWVAATDHAGNGRCSVLPHDVIVDNTAPTTTDNAPFGAQNTDVTVTLTPGSDLSAVASTEYRVDGGSWTAGTTVTVNAPSNHSHDGMHTIDYRSTDAAGNVEATKTTHVTIDTTAPTGSAVDPSSLLTGTMMLTASPSEPDIASVQWLYRPAGSSSAYTSIGSDTTAPWQLPWITNGLGDGDYELEVIFTDTTGNTTTQTLSTKTIDNTGPASAAVTSPSASAVLSGTIALTSTSSDATSGIDPARTEYAVKATGDSSFVPVSGTSWNSTTKPDGPAEVEVTVWDRAGNGQFTSASVSFTVDNTAPSVSLASLSAVSGTTNLSASGSADIATVDFSYKPQAGVTYTAIGSASGPFTKAWATGALADGLYDVRAIATDGGGHTGTDVKTVRVDNTAPTGSLTAPAAATTVGGPNVSLSANAADSGAGVASVTFQYRAAGTLGAFTDVATDTSGPFTATLDSTPLTSGDYDLRGIVTDAAGNAYTTAVTTVTVDSTPPSATLNLPAVLAGNATPLSVTTSADAAQATYSISPAGAMTWAQVASSSTGPAFSATFDTTSLGDGPYDLRAVVADRFGNTTTVVTSNVGVDNTAPAVVSTSPADGSVVSSVGSMSVTASENLSAVNSLRLDGVVATFTPSISGATVTFNVGSLPPGNHALTGRIVDAGGLSTPFRLNVTIPYANGDVAETAKNVSLVVSTTLGAADDSATVTVPANIWQQPVPGLQDFLVLHIDPTAIGLQGSLQFASTPLNVWMNWELAGSQEHHFDAPLEIVLTDATGGSGYPVTFENNAWRTIQQLDAPGILPASWQDGYWRDHGSVHILTRHLSLFALVNSLIGLQPAPARDVVPERTAVDPGPTNGVARSPFLLTISLAPRVRLAQETLAARLLLSGSARIDVTLDAKPFRRIQRWHHMQLNAGATILPLKLRQKLPPGSYRLFWKATSLADGSVARRITRLQIVGSSRVHAATTPQILIIGSSGQTALSQPHAHVVRLTSEQAYLYATYQDVSVILLDVDVDPDSIQLLNSLRTIFPSTAVIAISKDPAKRAVAAKAGAIVVPRSTSPAKLRALIGHVLAANRARG